MRTTRLVNATWQWAGDADLIETVAQGADVVAVVEARTKNDQPVRVRRILGRAYQVAQKVRTGALAGCALAVRRASSVRLGRWQSVKAAAAGRGVQQRNLLHAVLLERATTGLLTTVYEDHYIVIHNPLQHTGRQDDAVRAVKARKVRVDLRARTVRAQTANRVRRAAGRPVVRRVVRWIVLGDFNQPHTAERRALVGTDSGGHDVMGAVWGPGWGDVTVTSRPLAHTDHHVITIHTQEP